MNLLQCAMLVTFVCRVQTTRDRLMVTPDTNAHQARTAHWVVPKKWAAHRERSVVSSDWKATYSARTVREACTVKLKVCKKGFFLVILFFFVFCKNVVSHACPEGVNHACLLA